jgi:hypothetical protein
VTRDRNKTVTQQSFALLIPASHSESMGEATFEVKSGPPKFIRAIDIKELKKVAGQMRGAQAEHFFSLLSLRGALEARDELQLRNAKERLAKAVSTLESERQHRRESDAEREQRHREWVKHPLAFFFLLEQDFSVNEDAFRLFSHEVSRSDWPRDARIVLWWNAGSFRPAIYCENAVAALYIHTFFISPVGGPGFRSCPYDGEQFFQGRPNQEYCCPAHREAHRVARWRAQKKG